MITQSGTILYKHRGLTWLYTIWLDDGGWYWRVGSQDGVEQTEEAASNAARDYIKGVQRPPSERKG